MIFKFDYFHSRFPIPKSPLGWISKARLYNRQKRDCLGACPASSELSAAERYG